MNRRCGPLLRYPRYVMLNTTVHSEPYLKSQRKDDGGDSCSMLGSAFTT
jgi:hypothetical protein